MWNILRLSENISYFILLLYTKVAELSSRSALLQWWPPDYKSSTELEISESGLSYEVLLSDKGKEGKYKSIYSGAALSCR